MGSPAVALESPAALGVVAPPVVTHCFAAEVRTRDVAPRPPPPAPSCGKPLEGSVLAMCKTPRGFLAASPPTAPPTAPP
eukprot:CAMPEP_0171131148 /NCGR_PEP_ID=MMETSP0766_2-20121228/122186_1 /TAXON_ID=439317 /ORGANISM="Gambierdiscus australes, Strain CAWD 149" /LENGTH=78 /DNA_ID=CAMNT_0011594431 /DNA_START=522 /DNA_END=754 /DNA_ORIENTATION=+